MNYDVTVVGGGPAGISAALRARELGARVAVLERANLGGTCTNDGCVPTRVLARAARLVRDADQFADYGLLAERPTVNFAQALAHTQNVVYQLQEKKQLLGHLEQVGIETFSNIGDVRFVDPHQLAFSAGKTLYSEKIILCVGGAPRRLNFPGSDLAITHNDVWTLQKLPDSIIIVGGGATGCQLASIFAAFGSRVTLMDIAPRLLLTEDAAVSSAMAVEFKKRAIEVILGVKGLTRIERQGDRRQLIFEQGNTSASLSADMVLLAVGWPGNVPQLNLDAAGVRTRGAYIDVNDSMQTSTPHIFAAGDITGRMMLVQSANQQALIAAENAILGTTRTFETRLVPHGGFTDPEYASVGLTEDQSAATLDCVVATVPYTDLDRAVIDGHLDGFCKLIVERSSRHVVGAHVIGELAVEIVQFISAAMAADMAIEQLADLEIAYPTYVAIVGLAARQICRELQIVPVAPEWRALKQIRGAEWERRDS